ncbi:MAG: SOS response-associated peptidase [Acetobacteraceae bacterium]|nr:SOS response-associated peptidase [Acetobacteraceae bacterium]
MCGRYAQYRDGDRLRKLFATVNPPPNIQPSWNVAPTRLAPVVRRHPETGARHLDLLRWGLVPHWTKTFADARSPINARSETAGSAPMFRDALAHRRCLVPIDAFYEWQVTPDGKIPHAIARQDDQPIVAAGLWEGWRGPDGVVIRSFAILTTTACPALAHLHERMPVVLEAADFAHWLGEAPGDVAALLRPSAAGFRVWQVGTAVGNVRNDGAELLRPVA